MKVKAKAKRIMMTYRLAGEKAVITKRTEYEEAPVTDTSGTGKFGKPPGRKRVIKTYLIIPDKQIEIENEDSIVEVDIPDEIIYKQRKWENVQKFLRPLVDSIKQEGYIIQVKYKGITYQFNLLPDGTVVLPYTLNMLLYEGGVK